MTDASTSSQAGVAGSEIRSFLAKARLAAEGEAVRLTPLTGGVSSDIWQVETAAGTFVLKRALDKLRVARDWAAPVSRNANEVEWLVRVGAILPEAVPKVLAHDASAGMFAMEYLDARRYPVWKSELRKGNADPAFAAKVGETVAAIHAATAGDPEMRRRFANDATFVSLRLEPYFAYLASQHPDLSESLSRLCDATLQNKLALVHGDVSPKNILVGPDRPVLLDAECAWFGDPAFDLAFCLNHLLLKCVWVPAAAGHFLACFDALRKSYLAGVAWESPAEIEKRAAHLLSALLLARIDGKSPVEYIVSESDRDRVRKLAAPLVAEEPRSIGIVRETWAKEFADD